MQDQIVVARVFSEELEKLLDMNLSREDLVKEIQCLVEDEVIGNYKGDEQMIKMLYRQLKFLVWRKP